MKQSPYLKSGRLENVIRAIQVMGAYTQGASRRVHLWVADLGDDEKDTIFWLDLFKEHPEFFRIRVKGNETWISLAYRFAFLRSYDKKLQRELTNEEILNKKGEETFKEDVKRKPLNEGQINLLVNTAINLHKSALATKQEGRWFWPVIISIIAVIISVIGNIIVASMKP